MGSHCQIMRAFGLSVDIIDKYEREAELVGDFNEYNFKTKYDMIHCSHVIIFKETKVYFLDKIFDLLNDDGDLNILINFSFERFVEGHISIPHSFKKS